LISCRTRDYSFAFFVYLVPIVSETRQAQIIVKSPEGGDHNSSRV